jgi:hypothetical protein
MNSLQGKNQPNDWFMERGELAARARRSKHKMFLEWQIKDARGIALVVLANRMHRRRPIKVTAIAQPRRTLEIAALLSVMATRQSDTALRLIEMRIAEIWTWAQELLRPQPRPVPPEQLARELVQSGGTGSFGGASRGKVLGECPPNCYRGTVPVHP